MDERVRLSRLQVSRRRALVLGGTVGLAGVLAACATGSDAPSTGAVTSTDPVTDPAALLDVANTCVLAQEETQGPYWFDVDSIRSDIREGRPGLTLALALRVHDLSSCSVGGAVRPVPNSVVEIWHCDAGGVYSGVQGDTAMFLRGVQRTDAKGVALFRTIYPGWYPGRTVHIHTMVHLGGNVVHTGQLYFPEAVTDGVYKRSPYSQRPNRDPRNAGDSIYRNGGRRSTLRLARRGAAYAGSITMGVQRS